MRLELSWRAEDGHRLPMALWRPGPGYRMISTGVLGGGLGPREWVLNAQVPAGYARTDPAEHLRELARGLGLTGPGIGLLTAAQVTGLVQRQDEGAQAAATVGLSVPTWAAAPPGRPGPRTGGHDQPHRRRCRCRSPTRPSSTRSPPPPRPRSRPSWTPDSPAPGPPPTPSASPRPCRPPDREEEFTGPRSVWGARIARAVHAAVHAGAAGYAATLNGRTQ